MPGQTFPWMTVVGVVKDVKEDLFNYRINRPVWYVPYAQVENNFPLNLVVRTRIDPTSLIAALRDAIRTSRSGSTRLKHYDNEQRF